MDFIELKNISKKYINDLILRKVNYRFEQNKSYAITGPNGSGKSTLLKICASYLNPSSGEIIFHLNDKEVPPSEVFRHISMATPYMELPEEFSPNEILEFHLSFKKLKNNISRKDFLKRLYLDDAAHKTLRQFSSGMKQRFKIGLAIMTESDILLLDEPVINLDEKGVALYRSLMEEYNHDRITLICSNNVKEEISFCDAGLNIMDYK